MGASRGKSGRYPNWEQLEEYIKGGIAVSIPIPGPPRAHMVILKDGSCFSIYVQSPESIVPECDLLEINFSREQFEGIKCLAVSTSSRSLYRIFFSFACAWLDSVQLSGLAPELAIVEVSAAFRELLNEASVLSEERQTGLIGELLCLQLLIPVIGFENAIDAWHVDDKSEHDFDLGTIDLEVKTTLSEVKCHMIGSLTQLMPTGTRALYLASFQITKASVGEYLTLPKIRDFLIDMASTSCPHKVGALQKRMEAAGWNEDHRKFYKLKARLRTNPMIIRVDSNFPAIVPSMIENCLPSVASRILQVSYRINVDGLGEILDLDSLRKLMGVQHGL